MNLTKTLLASAAFSTFGMAASAQSAWDGAYGGWFYSGYDGTMNYSTPAEIPMEGSGYGVFAGYNFSARNVVYGAEIVYQDLANVREVGSPTFHLGETFDIKGRVGFSLGEALVYGVTGWSSSLHDIDGDIEYPSGMIYGVGVDYRIGDRYFAGLEYLRRDISGPVGGAFYETNLSLDSISLRAGIAF